MCSHFEEERQADRKAEERMASQADKIHNALKGKLSWTAEEWLKNRRLIACENV